MRFRIQFTVVTLTYTLWFFPTALAQNFTTPAPDGMASANFTGKCVTSSFFAFSYRLPEGVSLDDMSTAPNGGVDPTHRNFVLFKAYHPRGANRDVVNAAAEDRRSASDQSASSWMRALHNWNATRKDVPKQGEVGTASIGTLVLAKLEFQQSRDDGAITYETAYAYATRGYVVYFIFGSVDKDALVQLEKSMESFSANPGACRAPP